MNMNILHPAEQLTEMIKRIYDQRLTTTSGGNLSIKDENGDVWITPGAIDKGTLTRKGIFGLHAVTYAGNQNRTGGGCSFGGVPENMGGFGK